MFTAENEHGELVYSCEAEKGIKYYCPSCGEEMIFVNGMVNEPHFRHKVKCTDEFRQEYEDSGWVYALEYLYPELYPYAGYHVEPVVTDGNERHTINALIPGRMRDVYLLLQEKSIPAETIDNMYQFYTQDDRATLIHIINCQDKDIYKYNKAYKWRYYYRIPFSRLNMRYKNIHLFLDTKEYGLLRVVKANNNLQYMDCRKFTDESFVKYLYRIANF